MFDWFSRRSATGGGVLLPPAVAASLWIVADLATRLLLRLLAPEDQTDLIFGVVTYGVVLLTAAVFGWIWVHRYLLARVWAYLLTAALAAAVVIGLFGPWLSGEEFGNSGAKIVMLRMLVTLAILAAGGVIGALSAVALGRDPTSRAWKAQAEQVLARRR